MWNYVLYHRHHLIHVPLLLLSSILHLLLYGYHGTDWGQGKILSWSQWTLMLHTTIFILFCILMRLTLALITFLKRISLFIWWFIIYHIHTHMARTLITSDTISFHLGWYRQHLCFIYFNFPEMFSICLISWLVVHLCYTWFNNFTKLTDILIHFRWIQRLHTRQHWCTPHRDHKTANHW